MSRSNRFDVVVIGGGHAGAEAAVLAARAGAQTLLVTQQLETIGQMSCNPAIGGIAKGTVVREIDALGGIMGRATDGSRLQFRMLNRSKGPAVWSPRAQCDRTLYRTSVRRLLERQARLHFAQGTVARLLVSEHRLAAVETLDGRRFEAASFVLTAGTFLRGTIHLGLQARLPAGRAGEPPAVEIAQVLGDLGLTIDRFKTGTPPRIDGRSVDFSKVQRQDGDPGQFWFSWLERSPLPEQRACYLTHTTPELQELVQRHLKESALYGGAVSSRGPRYCPSIEDKIVKFPNAVRHQLFLEPEGLDTSEIYVNGLSTSLPAKLQLELLHTVPGLKHVEMTRPGYAIEYDYFPPTQLNRTLEVRSLPGLFLAGQVNGTTGYEEAAAQGVVAGLNAAASALGRPPIVFTRGECFIGVLVDDLVTRGVDEPYRLFTSRSEYRLSLRQDNALRRLYPRADHLGLLTDDERRVAEARLDSEQAILELAESTLVSAEQAAPAASAAGSPPPATPLRIAELARRPGVSLYHLLAAAGHVVDEELARWGEIELKYSGYLARERAAVDRLARLEELELPPLLDYKSLRTLSFEAREKLDTARPTSLAQASRIPGVTPSDLHSLVLEVIKARHSVDLVSRETRSAPEP